MESTISLPVSLQVQMLLICTKLPLQLQLGLYQLQLLPRGCCWHLFLGQFQLHMSALQQFLQLHFL
jgi:hypothetical protein